MRSNEEGTKDKETYQQQGAAEQGHEGQDESQICGFNQGQASTQAKQAGVATAEGKEGYDQICIAGPGTAALQSGAEAACKGSSESGGARPVAARGSERAQSSRGTQRKEALRGRRTCHREEATQNTARIGGPSGSVNLPAISSQPRAGTRLENAAIHVHESTGDG
jgi:hypothetical protein